MATRRPTRRPTIKHTWIASVRDENGNLVHGEDGRTLLAYDDFGNPVMETVEQPVGRRAGLHEGKSQTSYRRHLVNRRDRQAARAQLRRDPDAVELRQPRGRAVSLAS